MKAYCKGNLKEILKQALLVKKKRLPIEQLDLIFEIFVVLIKP